MPAFDERAAQFLGDLGIEAGQHLLLQFDDRHLDAEGVVKVAELQSDRAGADDDDALSRMRSCISASWLVITPSPIFIPGNSRSPDPDAIMILSASISVPAAPVFLPPASSATSMRSGDRCARLEQIDFVFLEQEAYAASDSLSAASRERAMTRLKSTLISPVWIPCSSPRRESLPSPRRS